MYRQHYIRAFLRNLSRKMTAKGLQAAMMLLASVSMADAHTGTVQFQRPAGDLVITLFATPGPPRAGLVELGVMVQNQKEGHLLLDRTVMITVRKEGGAVLTAQATRDQAKNRLLYVARLNLPDEGRWNIEITVSQGEDSASVAEAMQVFPAWPSVLSYWRVLLLPFVVIGLFIINQFLKRRLLMESERSAEPV